MEKVKKSLGSIMLSCTCNVVLACIGFYLLYLLFGYLNDNWETISTSIMSFMTTFIPLKNFLFAHLGKIFIAWSILALWVLCVGMKMEENEIEESSILNFILFLMLPVGSIIFFMIPFQLGWKWFPVNVLSISASFVLLVFFIAVICIFFDLDTVDNKENSEGTDIDAPEQLELFDKK
jgi:hypothetical protein